MSESGISSAGVPIDESVLVAMVMRKVGKYEVGRTIGEGTFAKVKFAQNTETGESVAMKVLDRQTVLKHKMVEQVKLAKLQGFL